MFFTQCKTEISNPFSGYEIVLMVFINMIIMLKTRGGLHFVSQRSQTFWSRFRKSS